MKSEVQLRALKTEDPNLQLTERATLACRLAKQFEKVGKYELAVEALREFWPDRKETAKVDGLDESQKADVLLRIGAIAGWLGSTDHGQETAKNILTRSIKIFERLRQTERVAEARGDLALCYYREGSFDEARAQLRTALHILPQGNDELGAFAGLTFSLGSSNARRMVLG